MVNLSSSTIKVNLLEKLVVNCFFPSDLAYHTVKSSLVDNSYSNQSFAERVKGIWNGKIDKYHKLLVIKQRHGDIPERVREICRKSPCGYIRLMLTYAH